MLMSFTVCLHIASVFDSGVTGELLGQIATVYQNQMVHNILYLMASIYLIIYIAMGFYYAGKLSSLTCNASVRH